MNTSKYPNPGIGCHLDYSRQSADDLNRATIELAQEFGFKCEPIESDEDESQILSEEADNAVSFLNELETRPYMFWQFEDNSLFLMADVESARENCEFVTSKSQDYPADDYRGEWLHVSDHGNATLYVRDEDGKDAEIWGIV